MIRELANHLWQSTLFACVVGLLTLTLKRNRAALRHGLWVAASLKFLVPFVLLIHLGNQLEWRKTPQLTPSRVDAVEKISEPLSLLASPAPLVVPGNASSELPGILLTLWLCGFAANTFAWWRRWRHVRAIVRAASPMPLNLPVPVFSSPANFEPGVFGIFRPVLLLPDGVAQRLTPDQLESVIAHELCHVRRRDNLASAIHMLVEALFWFHPLVWWMQGRLVEERERACDEEVLRMGGDPQVYAEGILAVCKLYLQSPLPCVSGVTGSDLKRRVENIMINRASDVISTGRKLLLAVTAATALTAPLIVGAMQPAARPVSQRFDASALPGFEVASIKPSGPDSKLKVVFGRGGKLSIANATLRFLIKIAYDIGDDQLAGGPAWVSSKRFDLEAAPGAPLGGDPQDMTPDQIILFHKPVKLRLQRLLADRFQLELRKESTPMPVFELVIAKGGPKKLSPTKNTGAPQLNAKFGNGVLSAVGVDMTTLAKFLSEGQTGRPVVDMTSLAGKYDFHLEWTPDAGVNPIPTDSAANPSPADAGGISIFTALQQQLGLKLQPRTDSADRLVVTAAELPSPN